MHSRLESLEKTSDTDIGRKGKLQVGPVRAAFTGKVTLSDIDPPNGYRISGEGQGGVAGYAKGGAVVRLVDDGAGTLLKYEAKADVGGKLAQLGGRLINSTAKKLAGEFSRSSARSLGRGPVAPRFRPLPLARRDGCGDCGAGCLADRDQGRSVAQILTHGG